ncbi:MAG: hypothetical protein ACE5OY_00985 [Candidatus Bathyarchaeia archaeon]
MSEMEERINVKRLKLIVAAWEKFPGVHTVEDLARETGLPLTVVSEFYRLLEMIRMKGLYPTRLEGTERTYFIKRVTI